MGGLPTDRGGEWWMKSKRVEAVLRMLRAADLNVVARIEVPHRSTSGRRRETRSSALAIQQKNRDRFHRRLPEGLSVLGYERDEHGNGRFLLGDWDEARR